MFLTEYKRYVSSKRYHASSLINTIFEYFINISSVRLLTELILRILNIFFIFLWDSDYFRFFFHERKIFFFLFFFRLFTFSLDIHIFLIWFRFIVRIFVRKSKCQVRLHRLWHNQYMRRQMGLSLKAKFGI